MVWMKIAALLASLWLGAGLAKAESTIESKHAAEAGVPLLQNFSPLDYGAAPQNWAVTQDRRGVIYVGNSDDGVLEYDGTRWRRIPVPNQSSVRSLAVDANGRVYVGCIGEFGYLEPDVHGRMHYVSLLDRIAPAYRNFADVWRIFVTDDGVYFGTVAQLFRLRGEHMDVWTATTSFDYFFKVRDRFYVRAEGRGLMEVIGDQLKMVKGGARFAHERIHALVAWGDETDHDGPLLVGTRERGWLVLDKGRLAAWPNETNKILRDDQLYDAQWLANGTLAIGTLQGGVLLVDRMGHLLERLRRNEGLINDTVLSMFQDREHGLWLALDNGLSRLDVASPLTLFSRNSGLDGTVLAMRRFQGRLYVGTTKGLFLLHSGIDGNAEFVALDGVRAQVWSFLDMGDSLLAATSQGVVEVSNVVAKPCAAPVCTSGDVAFSLLRSIRDPSRVFVGLRNGLAVMRRDGDKWIDEGRIPGISGDIRSLAHDDHDNLWLGTLSNGAIRVALPDEWQPGDGVPPQTQSFQQHRDSVASPNYAFVTSLAAGLRVVTAQGIYLYDEKRARLQPDTAFASLFPQGARRLSRLSESVPGHLWMYTADGTKTIRETGVAVADAKGHYHWEPQPLRELSGVEMYTLYAEPDGITWFGSSDGLYRLDSSIAAPPDKPLPTLLRKISDGSGHVLWGGASTAPPTLKLPWGNNSLRFDYASPNFRARTASTFQVQLEGADARWSDWSAETYRDYTNIHEGDYRFRVRSRDLRGNIGADAEFAFQVLPPWYRTWWAYLGYFVLAYMVAALGIQLRSAVLQRRNRELARLIEQRTEELSASNHALEEANSALQRQTITDALTGMKNRRYALENVGRDVASVLRLYRDLGPNAAQGPAANINLLFLLIDIDHFKDVNDHYGHAAGDRVLAQLRDITLAAIRETDTPVRWGGEEFLVIARRTNSESGPVIAEHIRRLMAQHEFDLGNGVFIRRTCSIGFASYPVLPSEPWRFSWEDVVSLADQCLYAAKHNGRNSWVGVRQLHTPTAETADLPLTADLDALVAEGYLRLQVSPSNWAASVDRPCPPTHGYAPPR
ncbi:histidine kinase [Rhodanobacter fulvus Jip2]|uniref:diguanylate cyclase n=1 Tax=Rhodanobacter fulvus Jip2 TaxID=1163408 RepID=I4VYH1_9GAMM|nr:diguanylate cyclase [Rhodanobacter fulvus]EIL92262.1 histidine kinase [Rhodanobacter fulvus Jip2]